MNKRNIDLAVKALNKEVVFYQGRLHGLIGRKDVYSYRTSSAQLHQRIDHYTNLINEYKETINQLEELK